MPIEVVRVKGLESFILKMNEIPVKLQKTVLKKIIRNSLNVVKTEAQVLAPTLRKPILRNGYPVRLPGTLKKAITVRPSKVEQQAGNVGLFVNVKPLPGNVYKQIGFFNDKSGARKPKFLIVKKSQRSALNPRDPYYWRWQEFGTKNHRGKRFLQGAATSLNKALEIFQEKISDWVSKSNSSGEVRNDP